MSTAGTQGLKGRTVRGGAITGFSQALRFVLTLGSTAVLARLLTPADYGLVTMVGAVVGFVRLLADAGLSTATVQRQSLPHELISTVFWINTGLGAAVTLMSAACAPVLAWVFAEPRVTGITAVLAATFTIDALMAQHHALLRRQMRFKTLALIDVTSLLAGIVAGVVLAWRGFGYWALVAMQIVCALVSAVAVWAVEPWRPGPPRRGCGARGMMRFGFFLTGTNALNYLFRNADNVLIGWYWGAGPLGLYTKAYGLLLLPIMQINAPVGGVAVPALSRLQGDPERFRRYFLGGYSVVVSAILPVVVTLALFADEVVRVMLGPQWDEAARLFRLLAPAALIGALLNPLGWLFIALGRPDRQFWMALGWACFITLAFALGLRHGPAGVATAYSLMSCVLAWPLCRYATRGAPFGVADLLRTLVKPAVAVLAGAAAGLALKFALAGRLPAAGVAVLGGAVVVGVYGFVLLVLLRYWPFYRELLLELFPARFAACRGRA